MQKLHVVGFTTDLQGLILSARKGSRSGSYTVVFDGLLAAIEEGLRLRGGDEAAAPSRNETSVARPDVAAPVRGRRSELTPREIQARLRSGRSLVEVSAEAGVDEAWVWRFAAPVLAERAKVIGRARELVFSKPRRGPSAQSLGTSVRWTIADRGVRITDDEFDLGWSAAQLRDHVWVVKFSFLSRGRPQLAEWQLDLPSGGLTALNRLASTLAFVDPGRRGAPTEGDLNPAPPTPGRVAPASSAAGSSGRSTATPAGGSRPAARKVPAADVLAAGRALRGSTPATAARPAPVRSAATRQMAATALAAKAAPASAGGAAASKPNLPVWKGGGWRTPGDQPAGATAATGAGTAGKAAKATRGAKATKASKARKASATKATAAKASATKATAAKVVTKKVPPARSATAKAPATKATATKATATKVVTKKAPATKAAARKAPATKAAATTTSTARKAPPPMAPATEAGATKKARAATATSTASRKAAPAAAGGPRAAGARAAGATRTGSGGPTAG